MEFTIKTSWLRVFFLAAASWSLEAHSQDCTGARDLFESVNKIHIEPQALNDEFSVRVFREFLYQLDPGQDYLSREDSVLMNVYSQAIDDQLTSGTCRFLSVATDLFRKRIQSTQRFIDSTLQRPLNYKRPEEIKFIKDQGVPASRTVQRSQLVRELKIEILTKALRLARGKEINLEVSTVMAFEDQARESVKKRRWRSSDRLLNYNKGLENFVSLAFQRSICLSFDPHTEYFTEGEMESFERQIHPVALAFGLDLCENRLGEPTVERMLPGGPAWRSNELSEGDVLVSMTLANATTLDFAGLEINEVLSQIQSPDVVEADFRIRKADGRWKTVSLKKEKIENAENLISSFVIDGGMKMGYVALPGFYTSGDESSGRGQGCAGDVAKEIIKLKQEKIQGLVLDLRYNGGGSVAEALELAGIFVDSGPLATLERRGEPVLTLRDDRRGSIYDGPLLVMVNSFSASASELVAAALQDYHRAVIMGCGTYGKATGQIVIPIGAGVNKNGFAKVTVHRLNRVTGKSLQMTGVQPDVALPEITQSIGGGESELRHPLLPKDIVRKTYYTALPNLPVDALQEKCAARVTQSKAFQSIIQFEVLLQGSIPLEVQAFVRYMDNLEKRNQEVATTEATTDYTVRNIASVQGLHQVDDYHRQVSEAALKEIQQNHYIREAYQIMFDLLNIKK
jgi:carboxyl-terminal processing protease